MKIMYNDYILFEWQLKSSNALKCPMWKYVMYEEARHFGLFILFCFQLLFLVSEILLVIRDISPYQG